MIDLINCISWLMLTIAIIYCMIKIMQEHNNVKKAIVNKINAETERIKNERR